MVAGHIARWLRDEEANTSCENVSLQESVRVALTLNAATALGAAARMIGPATLETLVFLNPCLARWARYVSYLAEFQKYLQANDFTRP
jgi:hypothetical protein